MSIQTEGKESKVYNGTPKYSATIKCIDPIELTQIVFTVHGDNFDRLLADISARQADAKAYGFEIDHFPFNQPQPAQDWQGEADPTSGAVPAMLDGLLDENGVQCVRLPKHSRLPSKGGRPQKWCPIHEEWMWLKPKDAQPGQRTWWSHPIGRSGEYCYGIEEISQEADRR